MSEVNTLLNVATTTFGRLADDRQSFSDFTRAAQLLPLAMFDRKFNLLEDEIKEALLHLGIGIYIGQYLQFVQLFHTIGNVTVETMLNPKVDSGLKTNRQLRRLGGLEDRWDDFSTEGNSLFGMCARQDKQKDKGGVGRDFKKTESKGTNGGPKVDADFARPSNLAVGKIVNVPLMKDGRTITIPTTVRLSPRQMDENHLTDVLHAFIGRDNSVMGRWHQLRSDQISMADWLTGKDLAQESRRLRLKDKDRTYALMRDRQARGKFIRVASGHVDIEAASNLCFMSDTTAAKMEAAMGGSFASATTRRRFFDGTGLMVLFIYNSTDQSIKMYQSSIDGAAIFTFRQIKPIGKDKSAVDINEVMKAYNAGQSFSPNRF